MTQAADVTRQDAGAPRGATRSLLAVESAADRWLFDLADIGEVVPLTPVTSVPRTQPWYAGLANVRGTLYSVVDLSAFHGGAPTARDDSARLLLAAPRHGINSALLVSRVLGLRSLDDLQALPAAAERPAWAGDRYRDGKGGEWTRLHLPELFKARSFLEIGI